MLKIILLLGYLMVGVYMFYEAYQDSEIEDQKDVGNVIGMAIASLLWPIIYLIVFICACVEAYYNDKEEI